jgi:HEAT repeat protein
VASLSNQAVLGLSDKDATGHVLARLTRVLQEDQDALVRSRAAIALGALRDEGAVLALESALLDEHSSVRSQAINALGQIGGERATMALGNILLNGSADKTERVMAAQALWKHDSEAARGYLRTGANDTDDQVRLASSKAPKPPKVRVTTDQLGPAETQ